MSTQQPKIVIEHISLEEFLWLGKEYPRNWHKIKGMDVWKDFNDSGRWTMVKKYRKNPAYNCQVVNHMLQPDGAYMPGTFVENLTENLTEIPEGFVLRKFPATEFLVVTHEWQKDWNMLAVEEAVKSLNMPEGYEKCDDADCQIRYIEIEHKNSEKGVRWENWIPIKKRK
jgi:predicted transcriptional regulator YdeE